MKNPALNAAKDACVLEFTVKFARARTPDRTAHAIVKARYAPKRRVTLCGMDSSEMQTGAMFPVGYEKEPGIAADPFFSKYGCVECGQRLAF